MRFLQEAFSAGSETAQPFLPYGAENAFFGSHLFLEMKTIILPRQARDRQGETVERRETAVFLQQGSSPTGAGGWARTSAVRYISIDVL
jgi:hypothetical protein